MKTFSAIGVLVVGLLLPASVLAGPPQASSRGRLGREVSLPDHLRDDEEFEVPVPALVEHGKRIFNAAWTAQEGGGRPLTKGTGKALADPNAPLVGARQFNRLSGPDANSCAGCHNAPHGISGGGGDFVTNVFVLGQRFDFVTLDARDTVSTKGTTDERGQPASLQSVANLRATTGLFGAGYLEMVARQMTADLQAIRDSMKAGETRELVSKGIHFGRLRRKEDGLWDTSQVEGLSRLSLLGTTPSEWPTLIVRPWHQAGHVISLRDFSNTAYNHHHGIQSTERFGLGTDPDGDGFADELTRADVTAVTLYQATLQVPGRVIPNDPVIEQAVLNGERVFERIGCGTCHTPSLPLNQEGWIYSEPNPYNPAMNLRVGEARTLEVDLTRPDLPQPRLAPTATGQGNLLLVPAYTDLKLHDITSGPEDMINREPLDQNHGPWSPGFTRGNARFLTKRLWGCANEPPYFHHGLFTTLRQAVLAHAGEATAQRRAFGNLSAYDQDSLIEFLKTLQVLPPGTTDLVVDENYQRKEWPPRSMSGPPQTRSARGPSERTATR